MNTPRRFIRTLAITFTGITLALPAAHATTIVGIRTPAQVVIAADSMSTLRGNRIETPQLVCKIFTVQGTGFAVSGLTKGIPGDFDAERVIAEILRQRNPISEAVNNITERLTNTLGSYLEQLKQRDPSSYAKLLRGENGFITSTLLAAYEGGQPVAIGVEFFGSEDSAGHIKIVASRVSCPGDCPNNIMFFFLGERQPIDRYIAEHGEEHLLPAVSGAPFLVQLVIDKGSKGVGPPVDVLVIDKNGESWSARKEGCGDAYR